MMLSSFHSVTALYSLQSLAVDPHRVDFEPTCDKERSGLESSARFMASMKLGMRPMEEETRGEISSTSKDSTTSGRVNDRHITVFPGIYEKTGSVDEGNFDTRAYQS